MSDTPSATTETTVTATTPPEPTAWTSGLSDELKGYVDTKGFKDPASVVDSYRNMEKLMGVPKERLLKLPDKEDAPEWGDIYQRLGRPEKPDGYKLELPEGANKEFAEWAQERFHALGLTRKQGEALSAEWNKYMTEQGAKMSLEQEQRSKEEVAALKREWGSDFDRNTQAVDAAATALGLDEKQVAALGQALGKAQTLKLLHKISASTSEAGFVSGDAPGGAMSANQAKLKIQELQSDREFGKRLVTGELQAKNLWDSLHKTAYGA